MQLYEEAADLLSSIPPLQEAAIATIIVARRRGKKRAILAVAHKLLVIISHKTKKPYNELGEAYFDQTEVVKRGVECMRCTLPSRQGR